MKQILVPLLCSLLTMAVPVLAHAAGPEAFCRTGQVFITWPEVANAKTGYVISRVDGDKLTEVARVAQGSGEDYLAKRVATQHKTPYEPHGFVIRPGGKTLDLGTGLWVHTVKEPGNVTYQIATVVGQEVGRVTVAEKPGKPEPILESIKQKDGQTLRTYIHWATPEMSYIDGHPFKFIVQSEGGFNKGKKLAFYLEVHAWGGTHAASGWRIPDSIILLPDNYTKGLPYDEYDWWFGYSDKVGNKDIRNSTIVNYTERRLLYYIGWAMKKFPVDENRIYMRGSSMGGTGTTSFALRHPEIFAGIHTNVPMVNPGKDGIGKIQEGQSTQWGKREWKLKTNEGINVWDRMNMTKYVAEHHGDLPFIKTHSGRGDSIIPWHQIPEFYRALQSGKHGFVSYWGTGDHGDATKDAPKEMNRFTIDRIKKNESYPAISNLSSNSNVGNGNPKDGDATGMMEGGFDWNNVKETASRWEIDLIAVDKTAKNTTLDLTPRRIQKLIIKQGAKYRFKNIDLKSHELLQQGLTIPDPFGLITITGLKASANGNHVIIEREPLKSKDKSPLNWTFATKPGFKVAGKVININSKVNEISIPKFWDQCKQQGIFDQFKKISGSTNPVCIGLSTDYKSSGKNYSYTYMVCTEIKDANQVSKDLTVRSVSGGKYAVFTCCATNPAEIVKTWDYIWKVWVPASGYVVNEKADSFEYYPDDYTCDIYIPVK